MHIFFCEFPWYPKSNRFIDYFTVMQPHEMYWPLKTVTFSIEISSCLSFRHSMKVQSHYTSDSQLSVRGKVFPHSVIWGGISDRLYLKLHTYAFRDSEAWHHPTHTLYKIGFGQKNRNYTRYVKGRDLIQETGGLTKSLGRLRKQRLRKDVICFQEV